LDNDASRVINRTALIENLLNQIILNYVSPRKDAFKLFWDVLLDSSIIALGSKVKVAMAISQQFNIKLSQNSLHKVVAYRNAFAHHALDSHPTMVIGKTPNEDELHYVLHIIKQSGKTERKRRDVALDEFSTSYEVAKKSLVQLLSAVKSYTEPTRNR
jgi:hypothetical protein